MKKTYTIDTNHRIKNTKSLDAQAVGRKLEQIRKADGGRLETPSVVEAARPVDSPLHPAFEWDDWSAAEAHRQWQARNLIKSVRVVVAKQPNQEPKPAYYSVRPQTKSRPYYQSAAVLEGSPMEFASAVRGFLSKIAQLEHAFDELKSLAEGDDPDQNRLARLAALTEALGTMRSISERLQ